MTLTTSPVAHAVDAFLKASLSGQDVTEALAVVVAETGNLPLKHVDGLERMIRSQLGWGIEFPESSAPRRRLLTWLDMCSPDGFVRERALRCLSAPAPNAFFCALALRRLNDWVPQVRQAAREHLLLIVDSSAPGHVVEALWNVLPHAMSWGRLQAEDRQVLEQLVSSEPVAAAMKARIIGDAVGPASLMLSQAGRTPALDPWHWEIAREAVQPCVRVRAYRSLLEQRVVWAVRRRWVWTDVKWGKGKFETELGERAIAVEVPPLEILERAVGDPSHRSRRVAAEFLLEHLEAIGADARRLAEKLASDSWPYVAKLGRLAVDRCREQEAVPGIRSPV